MLFSGKFNCELFIKMASVNNIAMTQISGEGIELENIDLAQLNNNQPEQEDILAAMPPQLSGT